MRGGHGLPFLFLRFRNNDERSFVFFGKMTLNCFQYKNLSEAPRMTQDSSRQVEPEVTLSKVLLRRVMTVAFAIGIVVSLIQIVTDAWRVSEEIDAEALETLEIVKDAATQAIYSIDEDLGEQVIDGLFKNSAVRYVAIVHPDETPLAKRVRPTREHRFSALISAIFGAEREYSIPLYRGDPQKIHYGDLRILYDTLDQGEAFMQRSILVMVSGIIRALTLGFLLYLVSHYLVTRPIQYLTRSLTRIDPVQPDPSLIRTPAGHKRDELGIWTDRVRALLQSILEYQRQRQDAEARIIKLSQYDTLTGLPNRSFFRSHLDDAIKGARKNSQRLAVLCIGVDDFKNINEQHGYTTGDQVLQALAERLRNMPELTSTVARLGGDQFALILFNAVSHFKVATAADQLLKALSKPVLLDTLSVQTTVTIGITLFPDDGEDAERLLQKAEQTMVLAKSQGHNQFQFYVASIDAEIRERRKLADDLASAIRNRELFLVYQPQIDLRTGKMIGAEALLRWRHETRGLVPPDVFIPIAESSELIHEIGDWVLDEAIHQMSLWQQAGYPVRISVNLSAQQFTREDLPQRIIRALTRHEVPPEQLELEVTETSFMRNLQPCINALSALRSYGIQTAVDDFGTGYSSLSYLKKLPVSKIKIDKQFVQDLLDDPDDTSIVLAVIQLGKSLGLEVIAEGVETERQEKYLLDNGCLYGQGYLFSRPVPPDELLDFFRAHLTT